MITAMIIMPLMTEAVINEIIISTRITATKMMNVMLIVNVMMMMNLMAMIMP